MDLTALRYAGPRQRRFARGVPLDHEHLFGVIAEHPGRHQPGHTRAEDDRPPHHDLGVGRAFRSTDPGETMSS